MLVKDILQYMKNLAPEEYEYKAEYDNIGLLVGDFNADAVKVLCCLDVTAPVLREAAQQGMGLIIAHHPFIYAPINRVTAETSLGRNLIYAIKNGINIYAAHTNLDFARDGINEYVAGLIGLRNITALSKYGENGQYAFGRVGDLTNKIFSTALKGEVAALLKDGYVRVIGDPYSQVRRVAVINGGGGGDVKHVDTAIAAGAECLITADVRHHVAVYAKDNGLTVIEPQHYTMEHAYINRLVQQLKLETKSIKAGIEIFQAQSEVNPRF